MKRLLLLALFIAAPAIAQDKKISELPSGSPMQPGDAIPIARAGGNYRLAGSDIQAPILGLSSNGVVVTSTLPLRLPTGTSINPSVGWADDSTIGIYRVTTSYLGVAAGSNIFVFSPAGFYPANSDTTDFGLQSGYLWKTGQFSRAIQGSKSKTLTDNVKVTFATVDVAAGSYGGGDAIWTLYCADANDRVSRSGRLPFAFQNTGGTETCAVGTASVTADVTNNAKAFTTVTFTCADGGTNRVQLEVQADCTIASPTTLTIEYRLDMPTVRAMTPGT